MATEARDQRIKIGVRFQSGDSTTYSLSRDTPLSKLMERVSISIGRPVNTMRFLFDGRALNGTETANGLGMKNGDMIEIAWPQTGGGYGSGEAGDGEN